MAAGVELTEISAGLQLSPQAVRNSRRAVHPGGEDASGHWNAVVGLLQLRADRFDEAGVKKHEHRRRHGGEHHQQAGPLPPQGHAPDIGETFHTAITYTFPFGRSSRGSLLMSSAANPSRKAGQISTAPRHQRVRFDLDVRFLLRQGGEIVLLAHIHLDLLDILPHDAVSYDARHAASKEPARDTAGDRQQHDTEQYRREGLPLRAAQHTEDTHRLPLVLPEEIRDKGADDQEKDG